MPTDWTPGPTDFDWWTCHGKYTWTFRHQRDYVTTPTCPECQGPMAPFQHRHAYEDEITMTKPTEDDLRLRFYYQKPTAKTGPKHEEVTKLTFALACDLLRLCPDGRNLSLAFTALEEVRMRANAAIACDTPENER